MVKAFTYNFWLGWGILLFSIFFIVLSIRGLRKNAAARLWPTISARVIKKHLEVAPSGDEPGSMYFPMIDYTYEVKGVSYTQNSYNPGGWRTSYIQRKAQDLLDGIGDTINIHYNSNKPEESYIYPLSRWMMVAGLVVSLGFLLVGLSLVFP